MIKATSFSSAVRTPRVFTWLSIFWLTSAVVVCQRVHVVPRVEAQCGQNVSLTCNVSSSHLDIRKFFWKKNDTVCEYEHEKTGNGFKCETMKEDTSHHRLTLTLINLRPIHAGKYFCNLQATQGANSNNTIVEVQECRGNLTHFINESHAECSFKGVYPFGMIHWFRGQENLTEACSTKQEVDQDGLYDILSSIYVNEVNRTVPYNCSLWMPSLRKYHSWMELPFAKEVGSSGRAAQLKWLCIAMEIITLKLVM